MHLRRGAFEHAPAAQAEQGVAAEQQALAAGIRAIERDVAEGMAGDAEDLELPGAYGDVVAVADRLRGGVDAGIVRADHRGAGPARQQRRNRTDVVVVVVGQQDRVRRRAAIEGAQDRIRIARIHHQRAAVAVAQQPDVVVFQCTQRFQQHLSSP